MRPEEVPEVIAPDKEKMKLLRDLVNKGRLEHQRLRAGTTVKLAQRRTGRFPLGLRDIPLDIHNYLVYTLFPHVACYDTRGYEALARGDGDALRRVNAECMKRVKALGPDPIAFSTNAIANTVASSITVRSSAEGVQTGRVVFVYGERGCGKTTLVYWSLASPLLILGLEEKVVKEVVRTLWVDSLKKYLDVLNAAEELARKGTSLPFVVVEDAATLLSKYDMYSMTSSKKKAELMAEIARIEQIAREGMGVTIFISHPELLIKPIRTLSGLRVEGRFVEMSSTKLTLWVAKHQGSNDISDAFATIHPYLKTPNDLFTEWLEEKLKKRRELVEMVKERFEGG